MELLIIKADVDFDSPHAAELNRKTGQPRREIPVRQRLRQLAVQIEIHFNRREINAINDLHEDVVLGRAGRGSERTITEEIDPVRSEGLEEQVPYFGFQVASRDRHLHFVDLRSHHSNVQSQRVQLVIDLIANDWHVGNTAADTVDPGFNALQKHRNLAQRILSHAQRRGHLPSFQDFQATQTRLLRLHSTLLRSRTANDAAARSALGQATNKAAEGRDQHGKRLRAKK